MKKSGRLVTNAAELPPGILGTKPRPQTDTTTTTTTTTTTATTTTAKKPPPRTTTQP